MVLSQNKYTVAIFSSRQDAKHALSELINAGFDLAQISIVSKDLNLNHLDGCGTDDFLSYQAAPTREATCAAIVGSMLGAVCGCLLGLGLIALPGVGTAVLAIGSCEAVLAGTLAGAGIGAASGGLLEALVGSGIAIDRAKVYSDRVLQGDYLVTVSGTDDEVRHAESILSKLYNSSEI